MTPIEKRIMAEFVADYDEQEGVGPFDSRLICRTLGELVAVRVRGRCEWSQSSEAVYVTAAGRCIRIAMHAGNGVGSQLVDDDTERVADVRIGATRHDETSTHLMDEPWSPEDMIETADAISATLQ